MPSAQLNYDALGRLTSVINEDGSKSIFNYDDEGNLISSFEIPECCSPKFFILDKSGNFTASDGAGAYYRISATATVTMPASPADGGVYKFKVTGGTSTWVFDGAEVFNHANGVADQTLVLTSTSGVLEMIAVDGGWDET